jgi:hypothetical protein
MVMLCLWGLGCPLGCGHVGNGAADQSTAYQLATVLFGTGLADDMTGLSQGRCLERQWGDDP